MAADKLANKIVPLKSLKNQSFAVADVPAAADHDGALIHCSNGAAGNPCLAYSNGTNWLQIAIGSAISAT
jgi:hypothetical protein